LTILFAEPVWGWQIQNVAVSGITNLTYGWRNTLDLGTGIMTGNVRNRGPNNILYIGVRMISNANVGDIDISIRRGSTGFPLTIRFAPGEISYRQYATGIGIPSSNFFQIRVLANSGGNAVFTMMLAGN
jgi:hypothetical protein